MLRIGQRVVAGKLNGSFGEKEYLFSRKDWFTINNSVSSTVSKTLTAGNLAKNQE